jgi:hypothetical protein
VIVLPDDERAARLARLRDELDADPRLEGATGIDVPLVRRCWRTARR